MKNQTNETAKSAENESKGVKGIAIPLSVLTDALNESSNETEDQFASSTTEMGNGTGKSIIFNSPNHCSINIY